MAADLARYDRAWWILRRTVRAARPGAPASARRRSRNIPADGPVLIVSNHESWWDIPALGVSQPRSIRYMAKRELYGPRRAGLAPRDGAVRSPCGEARPTATRCGACTRPSRPAGRSASSSRATARPSSRAPRPARAGVRSSRTCRSCPRRSGARGSWRPGRRIGDRLRRAADLRARRPPAGRRLPRDRRRADGRDPAPVRAGRMSARLPMVAVVGYPNAGKSTLVNRLSGSREGGRRRDPGRDARPQRGAVRLERARVRPRRHRRRRQVPMRRGGGWRHPRARQQQMLRLREAVGMVGRMPWHTPGCRVAWRGCGSHATAPDARGYGRIVIDWVDWA